MNNIWIISFFLLRRWIVDLFHTRAKHALCKHSTPSILQYINYFHSSLAISSSFSCVATTITHTQNFSLHACIQLEFGHIISFIYDIYAYNGSNFDGSVILFTHLTAFTTYTHACCSLRSIGTNEQISKTKSKNM